MAKINMRGLKAELAQKGYKLFKEKVTPRVEKIFAKETQKLVTEFEADLVTKEIEGGEGARNISHTLGGYGNLFTFIGFESGSDPISPIRSLLAKSIKITSIRKKRKELALILKFTVPTQEEIAKVTPSPWSTESWTEAIEKGMSGLGRYLYSSRKGRFTTSRSGGGIEAKVEVRAAGNSSPTPYISKILNNMLKSMENSLKRL
tara:strand:+ start:1465 stop:2076 length:612 start_codon:yes stop_codon:yes gene_type:complete